MRLPTGGKGAREVAVMTGREREDRRPEGGEHGTRG